MSIDISYIIIVFAVIFSSMVLHELMHGVTAYWLGDDTAKDQGRLTLNPLKHIDPFLTIFLPLMLMLANGFAPGTPIFGGAKPVPFRPDRVRGGEWGAALVGMIGPLTNLLLAFINFGLLVIFHPAGANIMYDILSVGVVVNLGFFAFNILPIPPLDGSRVLYAIAPEYFRRFMEKIESWGLIVVFAVVLLFSEPLGKILNTIITFFLGVFSGIFSISVV